MADPGVNAPTFSRQRDGDASRQYYIAVDRQQYKMGTLIDLLEVLGRKGGLPLAICCSSRDSLDAVCATTAACKQFSISSLHSDLDDGERAAVLESFRMSVTEWNLRVEDALLGVQGTDDTWGLASHLLVMTDACLPSNALGEPPLAGRVMINYDLPNKKEGYLRRIGACLGHSAAVVGSSNGGGGITISVVVGGEVSILRSIEDGCGVVIDEMPIHISEIVWSQK